MSFLDAFYRAMTGKDRDWEDTTDVDPSVYEDIERAAGSGRAAARSMGVSDSTWRGWKNGQFKPGEGNHDLLSRMARQARTSDREERLKGTDTGAPGGPSGVTQKCKITGIIGPPEYQRHRTIDIGSWVPDNVMADIVGAFQEGEDAYAQELIEGAVNEYYVQGMKISTFERIEFDVT